MTPAAGLCLPDTAACSDLLAARGAEKPENSHWPTATATVRQAESDTAGGNAPLCVARGSGEASAEQMADRESTGQVSAMPPGPLSLPEPSENHDAEPAVLLAELANLAPWLLNGQLDRELGQRDSAPADRHGVSREASSARLAGHSQPAASEPIWFDRNLTPIQQEAVRRALECDGVFLLQGPPASGKLRVVVELIRQWLSRGQRLVVASPRSATLHSLLKRLEEDVETPVKAQSCATPFLAVYCPAKDESSSAWGHWLPEVRGLAWAKAWQQRCRAALAVCQAECDRLACAVRLLEEAEQLALACDRLRLNQQTQQRDLQRLSERFRRFLEPSAERMPALAKDASDADLLEALLQEKRKHENCLADLHQRLEQVRRQTQEHEQQVAHWQERVAWQEQVVAVKQARAFWRWLWWQTLWQGRSSERLAEFRARLAEADQALQASLQQAQELEQAIARELQRHATAREQIVQAAMEHQRGQIEKQLQESESQLAELLCQWQEKREQLRQLLPDWNCSETAPASVEALRQEREQCRSHLNRWANNSACLRKALESLSQCCARPSLFAEWAHLRVAPLEVLLRQEALRRADRMIVLDAHEIRAEAWEPLRHSATALLVCGEPNWSVSWPSRLTESSKAAGLHSNLLQQQWQELGVGTVFPSCRWLQSAAGITCQLNPMLSFRPEQLHVEPLADQPEVILRFVESPTYGRFLAEVFLPSPRFDIRQAKLFLREQLDQVYLWPVGPVAGWREEDSQWCCEWRLPGHEPPQTNRVLLNYGQGVSEELLAVPGKDGRTAWRTYRLRFDKSCGWTAEQAQQWLRDFSNCGDHSDAAWLWCWRGGAGPLADWPAWVLGYLTAQQLCGLWRLPTHTSRHPRRANRERHRADNPDTVDLASDQRKRLPLAWQCVLPARGRIHPQQAEQLIQLLQQLLPTLRQLAETWQVVGWWEKAQLELLRWLWQQVDPEPNATVAFVSLAASPTRSADDIARRMSSITDRPVHRASDGVLLVVDSLPDCPEGVRWQDWIWCGALARQCLVLLEPNYQQLLRQLNVRGYNSPWLSDLLQRIASLPALPANIASRYAES